MQSVRHVFLRSIYGLILDLMWLALPLFKVDAAAGDFSTEKLSPAIQELGNIVKGTAPLVFLPIWWSPQKPNGGSNKNSKDPEFLLPPSVLAGYLALYFAGQQLNDAFVIPAWDFDLRTAKQMSNNPKNTIYINAIPKSDRQYPLSRWRFNLFYGRNPNVKYVEVSNRSQLLDVLNSPELGKVDRLEIAAHGAPGKFAVGDLVYGKEFAKNLKQGLAPGAEIRFFSCSLGGETRNCAVGEEMLRAWGEKLLPAGGKIFATNRDIQTFSVFREPLYGVGLGPIYDLTVVVRDDVPLNYNQIVTMDRNLKKLWENRKKIVEIEFNPPKKADASQCIDLLSSIVTRRY